jgi:membrane fusion protein
MLKSAPQASALQQLFRQEAVNEARSRLGAPVALLGISGWLLTLFFVALLVAAAVFACTAHYTHKEMVSGQVTPVDGSLRIIAARAGIAEQVLVNDGQRVTTGQELIGISSAPKLQFGDSLSESLRQNLAVQLLSQHQQALARLEQIRRQLDEVKERRRGIGMDLLKLSEARRLQESRVQIQEQTVGAAHAHRARHVVAAGDARARG